jgi:hypothetical protein
MRRLTAISLTAFVLALAAVGAATGASGSWGRWQPTYQGPITAAAGVVCPFEVAAEPVQQNEQFRYHYDDAGSIDGYQLKGPLVARITNTANGVSVQRNLASFGTVTFNPDGSYDAVVDGNFLIFFVGGDNPANELLLLSGRTVLHGAPSGEKTLVASSGRSEDLCQTLA